MHIHTLKANIIKGKEISQGWCATPPNVPKLGLSGVKDTAKTNKDLGMSCYIQVEYSVFFSAGSSLSNMSKIFSKICKNIFSKIKICAPPLRNFLFKKNAL